MESQIKIGDHVIYIDPHGIEHNALVTAVWQSAHVEPSLNVVFVEDDEAKHDQYGNQIGRNTSVVHESAQPVHGMKWKRA